MKTHLNLMPKSFRRKRLVRRRLLQWGVAWGILGLVVSIWYVTECKEYFDGLAAKIAREREHAPIEKLNTELKVIRADIDNLQQKEAIALNLDVEEPVVTLLGILSRATRTVNGNVYITELLLRDDGDTGSRVLTLHGGGMDNICVAKFVAALRDDDLFERIELQSAGKANVGEKEVSTYVLECVY